MSTMMHRHFHKKTFYFIVITTIAAASFAENIIAPTTQPKEGFIAQYNQLAKPKNYDPKYNSAPLFKKAAKAYVESSNHLSFLDSYWDLPNEQHNALEKWFENNKDCITFLREATSKEYYWVEYTHHNGSFQSLDFEELGDLRKFWVLLNLYAERTAAAGKPEEGFSILLDLYKLGTHFQSPKLMIFQMIGTSICRTSFQSAILIIQNVNVDEKTLKAFQQKLQDIIESYYVGFVWNESEKQYSFEVIHRLFTDDGKGNGKMIPRQLVRELKETFFEDIPLSKARKIAYKHPDKIETIAVLDNFFGEIDRVLAQSPWQLHQKGTDYQKEVQMLVDKLNIFKDLLLGLVAANVHRANYMYKRQATATLTLIAIARYTIDKGNPPEKLDVLVKTGYLRQLPPDPYNNGPLVYRRTGNSFVLYSIGFNFTDNGGKHVEVGSEEQGDYVFWPVQNN